MIAYALRRLFAIPLVLLATIVPALLLVHAAPNGPFDPWRKLAPAAESALAAGCDIDSPLVIQMVASTGNWVRLAVDDCTGRSLRTGEPVLVAVGHALPVTVGLAALALLLAVAAGVVGGALLPRPRALVIDRVGALLAVVEAVPAFVLAPLLVLVGALALGLFPPARGTQLVVPAGALALAFAAALARVTRAALRSPEAASRRRADLARGLAGWRVDARALRLAMLPVLAALGPMTSALMMGGIAVERVFDRPGLGPLVIDAASERDYNVLLGGVLAYAAVILVANLAFDLLYGVLDPRVRRAAA